MDTSEMRELLHGYLDEMDWGSGVSKDNILAHLAGRDETLRTAVNQFVPEGTYPDASSIFSIIPEQAWQDSQGDVWRGAEGQLDEDIPTNFGAGPVGQDTGDVYHKGGASPQTPGFGHSAGASDQASASSGSSSRGASGRNAGVGEPGSNAGEVDPGIAAFDDLTGSTIG
jgi:hypothetical protein